MVAFDAEQHRQLPDGRDVERFVEVPFAGRAVPGEDEGRLARILQQGGQRDAIGDAQLGPEVADHAHDVVGHAAEVEAAVVALGESGRFALELGEEVGQFDAPGGEDAEVAVHRQDELVGVQRSGAPHGNGFLTHAAEPFADSALPKQAEHFLFDESREQKLIQQAEHPVCIQTAVLDAQSGDVGCRHAPNLLPARGERAWRPA